MSSWVRPAPQEPQGEDWEKLSPEAKIQWINRDDRWGWVIYRCSYAKEFDGAWDDLKRRIQRGMRESIAKSDAPGIADTMDFIFVEDPALEGVSVEELRSRFQVWARDENLPDYDLDSTQGSRGSRYEFFLKVDGEGLWNGYVGLAQAWTDSPEDWVKVRASAVAPGMYALLENPEVWYAYYRPPEMGICNGL